MTTSHLTKVPDWHIHLKLLKMQNSANQPMTMDQFIDSIFYPTRFLGIYSRQSSKGGRLLWKSFSWFLLAAICANTVFCLYFFNAVIPSLYSDSSLRLCLDRFHFFIGSFSAGFCIVYGFISAQDLESIFDHIGRVDVVLFRLGLEIKPCCAKSMSRLVLRIAIVGVFSYIYSAHILFNPQNYPGCTPVKLSNIIGMAVTYSIVGAMEYQHDEFMRAVGLRFKTIKDRVEEIGPASMSPSMKEMGELEALVKAYNQLNETCIIINAMFGKQILFVIGTIFATVTSSANYIVQDVIALITQHTIESPELLMLNSYWGVSRLLELWFIIAACDYVVERAKEFTYELYQLMINDNSLRLSKNKKLYLHISSQTDPIFTAYGFFTLDNSLFHSVVAAATTYIVILIQFSQSSNSDTTTPSDEPNLRGTLPTSNGSFLSTKPESFTTTTATIHQATRHG